jgi:methylated-DNA-[protein]-cysteine S-methyltransferase
MQDIDDAMKAALGGGDEHAAAAARRFAERAAADWQADLAYATVASPLGALLLVASQSGLVVLHYTDAAADVDATLESLAASRSPRIVESEAALDPWRRELDEYFAGSRRRFDAPLDLRDLSGFRRRVLTSTARIPYGGSLSYSQVASAAGSPRAARAAGNALGSNPLPIVIPCHRVRHAGGGLGGYTGGLDRKRTLLAIEGLAP